jgi:hypothetical protein
MGVCVFKTSEITRCVAHALAAPNWEMGYFEGTRKPEPALLFVHDQGVYVMSNGVPRDVKDPTDPKSGSYVAYADGCDPAVGPFDDWYGHSRDLVGGDDFVEVFEVDPSWLTACAEFSEMHVTVSAGGIEVAFEKPKRRKKAHA